MMTSTEKPLAGKRILVPPARPEVNPLLRMLERKGAEVLGFPALKVAPPTDYGPMDRAIRQLKSFEWTIFSGTNCVVNFFERLNTLGFGKAAIKAAGVGAIGHGAYSALRKEGIEVDYVPKVHTAAGVTEGLGDTRGLNFLLVRVEGASRSLPERLSSLGAKVTEVVGYQMLIEASARTAEKVFGRKLHALALANPSAVRFLLKATDDLGIDLQVRLKGVAIAAVGPATSEAAKSYGLTPDIVSKGHIADLAESLTDFFRT
jgi:uroporphyrinogen III methyltransferase/synthase